MVGLDISVLGIASWTIRLNLRQIRWVCGTLICRLPSNC